jgi:pyruvate kinase
MDVTRLNFSHDTGEDLAATRAAFARRTGGRAGRQVTVLRDLPGPRLRTGELADGSAEPHARRLVQGDQIV